MSMFAAKKNRNFTGRVAGVPFDFNTTKVADDQDGTRTIFEDRDPMAGPKLAAAYSEIAKDLITHAALTIGGVMAGVALIRRICK